MSAQELYDLCRWSNQFIGAVAFAFLMARLVPVLWVLTKTSQRHPLRLHRAALFVVLSGYAIFNALAAYSAIRRDIPATWLSMGFTILHLSTIGLCVWWPPSKYDPALALGEPD